jgi:type IV secretory pathway VirB6-like protein
LTTTNQFDTTLKLFFDSILKVNEIAETYITSKEGFFTSDIGFGQQIFIRIMMGLYAVVVMLAATLILVATFSTYVFAKLGLILVLAVGPLFIGFALFPQTRTYAMNWVGQLLNFRVLIVMIAIMNGIIFALVKGQMDSMATQIATMTWDVLMVDIFAMMLQILIMAVLCYLFIGQLPSLVSALTGGNAGTSGMGAVSSTVRFGNSVSKMASGISAEAKIERMRAQIKQQVIQQARRRPFAE